MRLFVSRDAFGPTPIKNEGDENNIITSKTYKT